MTPWIGIFDNRLVPYRIIPLVNDQCYHIYNRSINKEPIFVNKGDCKRALTTINYYHFSKQTLRLSYFLALGFERRMDILKSLVLNSPPLVEIISYCLMPNHFHLLVKQARDNGISKFISKFQNSYTKYFNTKHQRQGHLFQGQFKAVRVENDEQLIHVHRYIHLNPYSSYVVKNKQQLESYPYSSLPEYLFRESKGNFCEKNLILEFFPTNQAYKEFIFNQADYQRVLDQIKHLTFE